MPKEVSVLIEQLAKVAVKTENGTIPLIDALKSTPRSGKKVRILEHDLELPFRSVYDHIISLPEQAHFFLPLSKWDLDREMLNIFFVFHDLSEALIGDAPNYTSSQLAADTYMSHADKNKAEIQANALLMKALPGHLKELFCHYLNFAEKKDTELYRFCHMVDKTDPIIAIWRYLRKMQKHIRVDDYLKAMHDFFANPAPKNACVNKKSRQILEVLQNSELARSYYHQPEGFFDQHFDKGISKPLTHLIENRTMHFVE